MMDLKGRIALVTGGGRRLGREFALALAEYGADVIVHWGTSAKEAEQTLADIRKMGVSAEEVQADLSDPDAAAHIMEESTRVLGQPTILVNNAAIFETGNLAGTDVDNWERHMEINLRAPFLLTQAFAKSLGDLYGTVLNITDWRATFPGVAHLAYYVSKAGLETLTRITAKELAPRIRVNALALGAVLPPEGKSAREMKAVLKRVPAGRAATLQEVADAMLFLLTNEYVVGETLFLDGGAHLNA